MDNKDTSTYKKYKFIAIVALIIIFSILLYMLVLNSSTNMFGSVSSYYLPIFSFGESEFPPLEF